VANVAPVTLPAPELGPTVSAGGKWAQEHEAFRRLLPGLLTTHRGQYVAIHLGQVIASGLDKVSVAMAALQQIGNVPIHVGLVSEHPEVVVRSGLRRESAPSTGGL
jgi:hypothetical protein